MWRKVSCEEYYCYAAYVKKLIQVLAVFYDCLADFDRILFPCKTQNDREVLFYTYKSQMANRIVA